MEGKPNDRYVYERARSHYDRPPVSQGRSHFRKKRKASMPPSDPEISNDLFTGFEAFVCPSCGTQGKAITSETLKSGPVPCSLCGQPMELLAEVVT